jgi:hypothetical protein
MEDLVRTIVSDKHNWDEFMSLGFLRVPNVKDR